MRHDFNFGKVDINVEFEPGDSFINHNLPPMKQGLEDFDDNYLDEEDVTPPPKSNKIGFETHKAEGKGIGNEHLRTEFKSVENKKPTTTSSPEKKAILTRNPLYM